MSKPVPNKRSASDAASVVAIDGPSASGKSTIARRVADETGALYVDSGSLYRGITWWMLEHDGIPITEESVCEVLETLRMDFFVRDGAVRFRMEEMSPEIQLRSSQVDEHVSKIAAMPCVRRKVVAWLRGMTSMGRLVMEGRDIGTAVFPGAGNKFYLDASPEERARRRHRERMRQEKGATEKLTRDSLLRRDETDMGRKHDPLRCAEDAVCIDTTGLTIEEVTRRLLETLHSKSLNDRQTHVSTGEENDT